MLSAVNLPFVPEIPRHLPTRRAPRLRLVAPIVGGLSLLTGLLFGAACSCGPDPRPTMETCGNPGTGWDGVTAMSIVSPRFVSGPQGGSHLQFRIAAEGTGLPDCIAFEGTLEGRDGDVSPVSGTVRATSTASSLESRDIYVFDFSSEARRTGVLTITALGRTTSAYVGSSVDAGMTDGGVDAPIEAPFDAGDDAPIEDAPAEDAPAEDAGEDSGVDAP